MSYVYFKQNQTIDLPIFTTIKTESFLDAHANFFEDVGGYYNFNFRFCNTGCPNEKGHVEKSVECVRKVFCRNQFSSYGEARAYLKEELIKLNKCLKSLQNGRTAIDMLARKDLIYL